MNLNLSNDKINKKIITRYFYSCILFAPMYFAILYNIDSSKMVGMQKYKRIGNLITRVNDRVHIYISICKKTELNNYRSPELMLIVTVRCHGNDLPLQHIYTHSIAERTRSLAIALVSYANRWRWMI